MGYMAKSLGVDGEPSTKLPELVVRRETGISLTVPASGPLSFPLLFLPDSARRSPLSLCHRMCHRFGVIEG